MKTLQNTSTNEHVAFFLGTATVEQVQTWVENNLEHLNLNEFWSCSVSFHNDTFQVSGDEDFREFELNDVKLETV